MAMMQPPQQALALVRLCEAVPMYKRARFPQLKVRREPVTSSLSIPYQRSPVLVLPALRPGYHFCDLSLGERVYKNGIHSRAKSVFSPFILTLGFAIVQLTYTVST